MLEKVVGMPFGNQDVYLNIVGGIKINEPALDLGIVLAIISNRLDIVISDKTICFGEVGLSGEVRGVNMTEQRIMEAAKMGFETCIMPKVCMDSLSRINGIKIVGVSNLKEAVDAIRK